MRKKIVTIFLAIVLLVVPTYVYAYGTNISLPGKLELGVKRVGYWISPGCEYTVSIPKAAENWEKPGWWNPINLFHVAESRYSNIDFNQSNSASNANATTMVYLKGGAPGSWNKPWRYAVITLMESNMGKRERYKNIGTIIHEMGHAFGLDDINNRHSIMHYTSDKINYKVTKDANDAVARKYP
ncbi:hypothetical protein [Helcococcus kunzii]